MELDRLSTGEKIAGGLRDPPLHFMFFDWFGVEVSGVPGFSGDARRRRRQRLGLRST